MSEHYTIELAVTPTVLQEALKEVERETGVRTALYPSWVQTGRLSRFVADDRLRRMRLAGDILRHALHTLRAGGPVQDTLDFAGEPNPK